MTQDKTRRGEQWGVDEYRGLYKRPRSPYIWALYRDPRRERWARRSTRTRTWAEALKIKRLWEDGQEPTQAPYQTVMGRYRAASVDKRSAGRIRAAVRHLDDHFTGYRLTAMTPGEVAAYRVTRNNAAIATVNYEVAVLRAAHPADCLPGPWSPTPARSRTRADREPT